MCDKFSFKNWGNFSVILSVLLRPSVPNLGPKAEALFAFLHFPKKGDANPTKPGNKEDDPYAPPSDGVNRLEFPTTSKPAILGLVVSEAKCKFSVVLGFL